MNSTLDKIIAEIRQLRPEEQQQLREALNAPTPSAEDAPVHQPSDRAREQQWINEHRDKYLGEWVVVEGDSLIVHGHDARTVYEAAREAGIEAPFLVRVKPANELPFGGW